MEPRQRIPQNLRVLLGANLVSSVGSGLTLPFLLIYLHGVRHIPLGVSGALIGATAVVGIPAGPLSGMLVDRLGARVMSVATLAVSAVGTAGLLLVRSPVSAVPVLLVLGFGQSTSWPTWSSLFALMAPDEALRPRLFARSFQLLNLGLGAGAMIAGSVVRVSDPGSFSTIYVIDAASYLAVVVALLILPDSAFASPLRDAAGTSAPEREEVGDGEAVPGRGSGGYREVFADRRFRRLMLASSFLAFAGYAAIDTGFVGYATHVVRVAPHVIAWAFGLNTALIVLAQPIGLRVAARLRRSTSLAVCAGFFGVAWAVLMVSGLFPGSSTGDGLVIAMFGVFSLGEILLSPVGGPLVTMLARPELQGRYNATYASTYTVLGVIGPSVAGLLIGDGLGRVYLGVLIASAAVAVGAFWALRRVLSPEIDNAPAARRAPDEPAADAAYLS